MRKWILVIFMALAVGMLGTQAFADQRIHVSVKVSGDFGSEIENNIIRELQKLGNVAITDEKPEYTISIVSSQVKWEGGGASTIVPISVVVRAADGSIGHWLVMGNSRNLSEACEKVVATINKNIFANRKIA